MSALIIYSIFCYLYEIGFAYAGYRDFHVIPILSILLAPVLMPIELGASVYSLLRKR